MIHFVAHHGVARLPVCVAKPHPIFSHHRPRDQPRSVNRYDPLLPDLLTVVLFLMLSIHTVSSIMSGPLVGLLALPRLRISFVDEPCASGSNSSKLNAEVVAWCEGDDGFDGDPRGALRGCCPGLIHADCRDGEPPLLSLLAVLLLFPWLRSTLRWLVGVANPDVLCFPSSVRSSILSSSTKMSGTMISGMPVIRPASF
jgi:hypothetical protein